jgi:hypothetical protein
MEVVIALSSLPVMVKEAPWTWYSAAGPRNPGMTI